MIFNFTNTSVTTEDTASVRKRITTTTKYSFEPQNSDANIVVEKEVSTEEYPIYNGKPEVDLTESETTDTKTDTILKKRNRYNLSRW